MHDKILTVTDNIIKRSYHTRLAYLERIKKACLEGPHRATLPCGNLAHGFAACSLRDKKMMKGQVKPNIAIISAYNDILSAHEPYRTYPQRLKAALESVGCIGQFAGGVPAMCDGVTQGQPGMELSLLSRDVIALSTSIALSHNLFDGALMLGICDKIVPGLLIAGLHFGHLPVVFVPAGPMPTGISNEEKTRLRKEYAAGNIDNAKLLAAEAKAYHAPGTCTFFGTANSNQLLVEMMGLHLPGASFVNPNTPLREALTEAAAHQISLMTHLGENYRPVGKIISEKSIINAMVGLLASGGSTNHTMHLIAIAKSAGILINWDDFSALSAVIPLIASIYPNGSADINHFQQAGGMAFFIQTLLEAGLLHENVETIMGYGLRKYTEAPELMFHPENISKGLNLKDSAVPHKKTGNLLWDATEKHSKNINVLRPVENPFKSHGGLQVLSGNIGRAVIKTSSLTTKNQKITAKAIVFSSQDELERAFYANELNQDAIMVIRFQGPKACGMPELHRLTPLLSLLQDKGFQVALVTDGRMSGASGRVPAAIHVTPEASEGGNLAKIQTGDLISLDCESGLLSLLVSVKELAKRLPAVISKPSITYGMGREMFTLLRNALSSAETGACSLFAEEGMNEHTISNLF